MPESDGWFKPLELPERDIIEMFRSGRWTLSAIAEKFAISRYPIRRILSKHFSDDELLRMGKNIGAQKFSGDKNWQYKHVPEAEVLREYLAGKSRIELARQHEVSQDKIQRVLRRQLSAEEMKANRYRLASAKQLGRISTLGGQWRQAWTQLTRIVRERDGGKCRRCSSTFRLTSHHLLPKILDPAQTLWLAEGNVVTLCRACHGKIEPKGWESIPSVLGFKEYYDVCGLYLSEQRIIGLLSTIAKQNSIAV